MARLPRRSIRRSNAPNLELIAQPFWGTTAGSLLHLFGIVRAYMRTCRRADVLFVRGMCPYTAVLYFCALVFRRPICHWIVGDPVALLRTSEQQRANSGQLRIALRVADRMFSAAWAVAHGRRVDLQRPRIGPRTCFAQNDCHRFEHGSGERIFSRADTCQGPSVRIFSWVTSVRRRESSTCWTL